MAFTLTSAPFGFNIVFTGQIDLQGMQAFATEATRKLKAGTHPRPFRVHVDMARMDPLLPAVKDLLIAGQQGFRQAGMDRSVVIAASAIVAMQMRSTAGASGIAAGERIISQDTPNAEAIAMAWLLDGVEPPKKA